MFSFVEPTICLCFVAPLHLSLSYILKSIGASSYICRMYFMSSCEFFVWFFSRETLVRKIAQCNGNVKVCILSHDFVPLLSLFIISFKFLSIHEYHRWSTIGEMVTYCTIRFLFMFMFKKKKNKIKKKIKKCLVW